MNLSFCITEHCIFHVGYDCSFELDRMLDKASKRISRYYGSPLVGPSLAWRSSGEEGQECVRILARMGRQKEEGRSPNHQDQMGVGRRGRLGGGVSETDAEVGLEGALGGPVHCPWRWHSLVSNFGNGHTRVSKLAGRLAAKDSE